MRDLPVIDDPRIGTILDDRYEVLGLLGKGGMGAIYRCRDRNTGATVAVKIILADLESDPEVVRRFEREIRANLEVDHPNVVKLMGHGRTADGLRYMAMELLVGRPLDEIIEDEAPLSSERIAHLGAQIALGLHAAHGCGVIHRDLKPENVIVGDDGRVKVFDFGLSLLSGGNDDAAERTGTRLTEMDLRIGTPLYMAPEYIDRGEIDARSDLYALGIVLYEAATGRPPFTGPAYQVLHKHATEAPRPIDERVPGTHPDWLRDAIERLIAKDPALRPQTGAAAAALLTRAPDAVPPVATVVPSALPAHPASARSAVQPRVLAAMLLIGAAIWHALALGAGVHGPDRGRGVVSWWAAAMAVQDESDPYDVDALAEAARDSTYPAMVTRSLAPPGLLLLTAWTQRLSYPATWSGWLAVQEAILLGFAAWCVTWWRPLGRAPPIALAVAIAAMGAIPVALDTGYPGIALLALLAAGLVLGDRAEAGAMVGLASLLSMRAWIVLPLLLVRRRFVATAAALAVAVGANGLALLAYGDVPQRTYWTDVLPRALAGDFTGTGQPIGAAGNTAPAALLWDLLPGDGPMALAAPGTVLVWGLGLVAIGALLRVHGRASGPWEEAAVVSSWLLAVLLLPILGTEPLVPLALPAIALCAGAVWQGRLDGRWAVPVGVAIAVMLTPASALREIEEGLLAPVPALAPIVHLARIAAAGVLSAGTVSLSLGRTTE